MTPVTSARHTKFIHYSTDNNRGMLAVYLL
jgi:hypothetical protein